MAHPHGAPGGRVRPAAFRKLPDGEQTNDSRRSRCRVRIPPLTTARTSRVSELVLPERHQPTLSRAYFAACGRPRPANGSHTSNWQDCALAKGHHGGA